MGAEGASSEAAFMLLATMMSVFAAASVLVRDLTESEEEVSTDAAEARRVDRHAAVTSCMAEGV